MENMDLFSFILTQFWPIFGGQEKNQAWLFLRKNQVVTERLPTVDLISGTAFLYMLKKHVQLESTVIHFITTCPRT